MIEIIDRTSDDVADGGVTGSELMLRRTGELAQRLQHVTPTLPVAVRLYVSTNLYAGLFDASASSKPDTLGWSGGTPGGRILFREPAGMVMGAVGRTKKQSINYMIPTGRTNKKHRGRRCLPVRNHPASEPAGRS